jgi:hypothetical protein
LYQFDNADISLIGNRVEGHGLAPRLPGRLDEEELADWRAGRDAGLSARRAGGSTRLYGGQRDQAAVIGLPGFTAAR